MADLHVTEVDGAGLQPLNYPLQQASPKHDDRSSRKNLRVTLSSPLRQNEVDRL